MSPSLRLRVATGASRRATRGGSFAASAWLAVGLATLAGCAREPPPATVSGTLRLNGQPLDNCLVTFLPEPGQKTAGFHSVGCTDQNGSYCLRRDNQQEGTAVGRHRVTVHDLSASAGVRRRDNGAVDAEGDDSGPPPQARRSRVPERYQSASNTPLRQDVRPGNQVIDLEVK